MTDTDDNLGDAPTRKDGGLSGTTVRQDLSGAASEFPASSPYHIERDEDGYEVLILHAVDASDIDELWVRKERLEHAEKK